MLRHFLPLLLLSGLCLPGISLPAASDPAGPSSAPAPPSAPLVDLLPLKKALAPLDGTGAIYSHTTLRMSGTRRGVSVTLREDLQITSRSPGCFRAALTQYDAHGGPHKKLLIVSDGAVVWTYRPGLQQYSVTPLASWKKASSDIPALGLIVGGFYLGDGRPLVQGFSSITPTNSAEVQSVLSGMDVTLSRQTKSVGNQDDYVYNLDLGNQSFAYQFYVATQTSKLTRIDLSGIRGSTEFTCREDILRIAPHAPLPASFFHFVPPPTAAEAPPGTFRAF